VFREVIGVEQMSALAEKKTRAHVIPFFVFMGIMMVDMLFEMTGFRLDNIAQPWYRRRPEYLLMLIQLMVVLPMLLYWRKYYEWNFRKGWLLAVIGGVVGIGIWIAPTHFYTAMELNAKGGEDPSWYKWFGLAPRAEGFDAGIFEQGSSAYWVAIVGRFLRAVVLVSLVEEIFWRGFLMRFILRPDGNYWKVPFGEFSWMSYGVVTVAFMLVHAPLDWLGAFFFGSVMYYVAWKSKSLFACVLMHGVANLIMGWYAFAFEKYGLW